MPDEETPQAPSEAPTEASPPANPEAPTASELPAAAPPPPPDKHPGMARETVEVLEALYRLSLRYKTITTEQALAATKLVLKDEKAEPTVEFLNEFATEVEERHTRPPRPERERRGGPRRSGGPRRPREGEGEATPTEGAPATDAAPAEAPPAEPPASE
ncbi:MAG: hypothetical protein ACYDCK_04610 [Thermoplasmatota archaeon]